MELRYKKEFYMDDGDPAPFTLGKTYIATGTRGKDYYKVKNDVGVSHTIPMSIPNRDKNFDGSLYFEFIEN